MNRYQIYEVSAEKNHAGSKATADVKIIAEKYGYTPVKVRMISEEDTFTAKVRRQIQWIADWHAVYKRIDASSVVLLQCPFHHKQINRERILRRLKEEKKVRFITLVHDVEKLRGFRYSEYYRHEFAFMLELSDILIVHNQVMKDYFVSQGCSPERIVCLEIFDYLYSGKKSLPQFERTITVAGNLDTTKCGYIKELAQLKEVSVDLYGSNYDPSLSGKNIHYHGSFPASEIPGMLNKGFGAVWDGNSIIGCQGDAGQYLRYNNPHKLSLYLASGLPVVIWKEAAEASFVVQNHLGFAVDDLLAAEKQINEISEEDYRRMTESVSQIAEKLKAGWYTQQALKQAEAILEGIK